MAFTNRKLGLLILKKPDSKFTIEEQALNRRVEIAMGK